MTQVLDCRGRAQDGPAPGAPRPDPDGRWPVADLARRVERALDLVPLVIELLLDDSPGLDLDALEAPEAKVTAEAAILLRAAAAVPPAVAPGVASRVAALGPLLAGPARTPRTLAGIALHPALARDHAVAHLVLSACGWRDPATDGVLAAALAAPTQAARERLPHRELEQRWLDQLAGADRPDEALVHRTALGRGVDVITGSRDDAYALTHALLYATDLGGHEAPLSRPVDAVLGEVRSLLAGALDDDDFDLAGELLLAWPLLGARWDATGSFGFALLAEVEDRVGLLPSLAIDAAGLAGQPPAARAAYTAATTYHTAFVMGLLCAVMLRRDSRPLVPGGGAQGLLASSLAGGLDAGAVTRQWQRTERAAPATFVVDVALRRAVRRLDLEGVRRVLQAALHSGCARTILAGEAARLLRRMAALELAARPACVVQQQPTWTGISEEGRAL